MLHVHRTTDEFDGPTSFVHPKLEKDDVLDGIRHVERRLEPFDGGQQFSLGQQCMGAVYNCFCRADSDNTNWNGPFNASAILLGLPVHSNDEPAHGSIVLLGLFLSKKYNVFYWC